MALHETLLGRLNVLEWALLAVTLYTLQTFLYAFLFSPVRHIPGPWWARVSRLPLLYATYKFRRTAYATDLLRTYGSSSVVIAPDEILTTDEKAMKTIYDHSAIKTPFYSGMGSWKGVKSTLGFIDYPSAAPTRNNLIQCFQNKNLATLVESIQGHVLEFTNILRAKAKLGKSVDGVVYFRLLALDVVTDVLWGEEKTLLSRMDEDTPAFLRRFHAFSRWNAFKSSVPGADLYVRLFGSQKWQQLRNDCNDLDITAKEALTRWDAKGATRHDRDVLSMLRSMNDQADPLKRVPSDHLPAYIVEMLAAGSSTTSHTVAFACYLLARHPESQRKLRTELFSTFPSVNEVEPKEMVDLPMLNGVLKETMRVYPTIPGPLERYLGKEIELDGQRIPPGVVASMSAYTQGRLGEVFPEAENWKPERWLDTTKRMEQNWIPFGTGSRACPGQNLAITELKYMIGTVFRSFRSVIPPGHEQDMLELADIFAAGTRTGHCWLKFDLAEEDI